MAQEKVWSGPVPKVCQACGELINGVFSDMKTKYGYWALLCENCSEDHFTFGYGTGRGQQYAQRAEDDKFVKIRG